MVGATALNVIAFETAAPFTVTLPELGLALYPETAPTVYVYVPFASLNVIVDVVELDGAPFNVTDQLVPDGSPLSVNVTAYVVTADAVNVIAWATVWGWFVMFTKRTPEEGFAEKPAIAATLNW